MKLAVLQLLSLAVAKQAHFKLSKVLGAHPTTEGIALLQPSDVHLMETVEPIGPFKLVSSKPKTGIDTPLLIQDHLHLRQFTVDSSRIEDRLVPDHTDKQTVRNLAQLTENAYFEPTDGGWKLVEGWNVTAKFGFESTGIRGYVFESINVEHESSGDDTNVVIVIKGTSLATPIGSGPTARLDKLNDNLMFSCCCAKSGWEWTPICNCPVSSNVCSQSCILRESSFDGSYYNLAQTIYLAVKGWYPRHTNIWMAGHSLGGALASLVALTNGVPAFAYEAPGDLLYASRLGLLPNFNSPDEMDKFLDGLDIYHFGNTGDPIYLGQCTGPTSSCYVLILKKWFDYSLESKCHVGKECIYDIYEKKPVKQLEVPANEIFASVQYHSINYVINKIIDKFDLPKCVLKKRCLETECQQWTFKD